MDESTFSKFLGNHDADEYSSDSDQEESDLSQYQNDKLSEYILNSKGSFARDSLETRIKTLAAKPNIKILARIPLKVLMIVQQKDSLIFLVIQLLII